MKCRRNHNQHINSCVIVSPECLQFMNQKLNIKLNIESETATATAAQQQLKRVPVYRWMNRNDEWKNKRIILQMAKKDGKGRHSMLTTK